MSCEQCVKYIGDCGFHLKDNKGHINYDCPSPEYTDKCGYCTEFEGKPKVKHTFHFTTSAEWTPNEPTCWVECPFACLIPLGNACRFKYNDMGLECPFTK